jgi:hypothetical protein
MRFAVKCSTLIEFSLGGENGDGHNLSVMDSFREKQHKMEAIARSMLGSIARHYVGIQSTTYVSQ